MNEQHTKSKCVGNNFIFPLSIFFLLISLFLLIKPNIDSETFRYVFTNSDSFFHHHFFQDIIIQRKPIQYWVFPHAFLLIPEFLLFLGIRNIQNISPEMINVLTSIFTLLSLEVVLFLVLRKEKIINNITNSVFILLISIFNLLLGTEMLNILYLLLLTPHFHTGTITNSLITLIIFEKIYTDKKRLHIVWAIYAVLNVLFAFSDPLYLAYVLTPILLMGWKKNNIPKQNSKKLIVIKIITATCGMVGFLFYVIFFPMTSYHLIKHKEELLYMFKSIFRKEILYTHFSGGVYLKNYLFIIFILLLIAGIMMKKKGTPSLNKQRLLILKTFFLTNIFISYLIYSSWGEWCWIDLRSFMVPILILIFSFLSNFAEYAREGKNIKFVFFIGLVVLLYRVEYFRNDVKKAWVSDREKTRCIEKTVNENGWGYGIADFWWATKLNTIGNYRFRLLPVNNNQHIHDLSINKAIGDSRFNIKNNIDYVFCGKEEEKEYVEEILGPPNETIECSHNSFLLFYKDNTINYFYERNQSL